MLEVASPATADNDAKHKAQEYARIGVQEYWRLDPDGTLMGSALEGYEASGGKYEPVQPVTSSGRERRYWSRVLGLELRSRRQARSTVLVLRNPRSGEETDGAPEEAERRRRIAERDMRAARQEASTAKQEAIAAEERASAAEERASEADERVRALEEQVRALTAHTTPPRRDR